MNSKKRVFGIILIGIIALSVVMVSAGFWGDLFSFGEDSELEGELPESAVATVKIEDISPPEIRFVSDVFGPIAAADNNIKLISRTTPDTTWVNFTFLAQQGGNQPGNLQPYETTSATGYFFRGGELDRNTVVCNPLGAVDFNGGTNNAINYSCTVDMKYYDGPGTWIINISVTDNAVNIGYNYTKTFTVLSTSTASTQTDYLNWTNPPLKATDTNRGSDNDLVISNDGNVDYSSTQINATQLTGQTIDTQFISVNKFRGNGCLGIQLVAEEYTAINSFTILRATSDAGSSDSMDVCITDFTGLTLSSQEYKGDRAWMVNFPSS